jgi:hypothetical protein
MAGPSPKGHGLRHIVLLRLIPEAATAERDRIEGALAMLVAGASLGQNGSIERDLGLRPESGRAATWMASIDFESVQEFTNYLASEEHVEFLREFGPKLETLLAIQVPS